jgi:cytochrome P450
VAVEKDPELFTSSHGIVWPWTNFHPDGFNTSSNLMYMDPPRHSSVRRIAAKAFGPRIVANFDPWVRAIVTDAIDDMVSSDGPFDYVQKAAVPIPSRVIARITGFPKSDERIIVDSTIEMFAAGQMGASEEGPALLAAAMAKLFSYVNDVLIPMKRQNPGDDMSSVLTQSMDAGEITEAECLDFHQLLINAGFETTHTLIGQSMRLMLEDPDIEEQTHRAIREIGPDRVVNEFLRYISPPMYFARTATRDTELAGQKIRKDDLVHMYYIAANRDPATFTDPHRFDPWREEEGSLAFGSGHHRCLGAPLARLELTILFDEMIKRNVRLKLAGEPKRGWSTFINQLTELPVVLVSGE